MYLMGIDVGTTGCKAIIFNLKGEVLSKAYQNYELLSPQPGWRELDPREVKEAVFTCIRQCCLGGLGEQVAALSISAQGEAVIPVDCHGNALCNSIVSFDGRTGGELDWVRGNLDMEKVVKATGVPPHPMFSLSKILWTKNHFPEQYARTWKFFCFADYIAYLLGAEPIMDYSLASRTMMFHVEKKEWDPYVLEAAGIDIDKLPALAPCGSVVGKVSSECAEKLGLSPHTVIAAGGHDQVCCALGAGVVESGMAMNSMGTTDSIVCVTNRFISGKQQAEANIPCGSYALPDLYANHSFVFSTGSMLQWFRNSFYNRAERVSYRELDEAAAQLTGPTGIYLLPHFAGSGTPYLDSSSKGVLAGLTLETDKISVYKALLEGICYELTVNIENMEKAGIHIEELRCIGGAAQSDSYLQIKADITGKPVIKQTVEEAGCLGAALLAGAGCGSLPSVRDALADFVKPERVFRPDPELHRQYRSNFGKYKTIYDISKNLFQA